MRKRDIGTNSLFYINRLATGPGATQVKFKALFVKQSFFSSDLFRFWSLGYTGGHTCVKNPPLASVQVCAKFGGDLASERGTQVHTVCFINGHRRIKGSKSCVKKLLT